jgi:hypothetical protein
MSVCVVATYPWQSISHFRGLGTPGAMVCSDTRLSSNKGPIKFLQSKQRLNAPDLLVCFTSSHLAATTEALKRSWGMRNVKKVGQALKDEHRKWGGCTEMLALVWKGRSKPQLFELMPYKYHPTQRRGIVGIGDNAVLEWMREHFPTDDPSDSAPALSPAAIGSLSATVGHPVTFPPPSFSIDEAALRVAMVFSEGITQAGGDTVALPVQVWTVQDGTVRGMGISASARNSVESFEDVTAPHGAAGHYSKLSLAKAPTYAGGSRLAFQLLS